MSAGVRRTMKADISMWGVASGRPVRTIPVPQIIRKHEEHVWSGSAERGEGE